jgi:hypothetical protein
VDPYRQSAASKNGSPDLWFGSFVGTYGVENNVNEHVWLRLLDGFLDVQHGAALVGSALGAGAMGQLLLVAVGALGDADGGQKVVRAAKGSAARRVASFRIRHDSSFRASALNPSRRDLYNQVKSRVAAGAEHSQFVPESALGGSIF